MCILSKEERFHPPIIDRGPRTSDEALAGSQKFLHVWEYLQHSQHQVTKTFQEEREGGALLGKGDIFKVQPQ